MSDTSKPVRRPLTLEESAQLFADPAANAEFPPILSPEQLAKLLRLGKKGSGRSTVYQWIAEGKLNNSVRKVGKHILIIRDRALMELFNKPANKSAA